MKDLLNIKRPVTDCGKPIVKLEAYSGCDVDAFTGNFYGEGNVQSKSSGFTGSITFKKTSNIHANISRVPRKIERTISYFCRTQKVRSSKIWQVEGMDIYPVWKMNEIEEMMEAETLSIDGQEVVYRGGDAAFSLALDSCKNMFLMKFNVEECAKQQIFGCSSNCSPTNDKYINITDGIFGGDMSTSKFYNSSKSLIATSYAGFKGWLSVQDGVTNVEEVDNSAMKCSSYKVLKVSGGNNIDTIYYATQTNQNNKIYLRTVDDISDLCNNQNKSACAAPIFGTPTLYEQLCDAIEFGTPILEVMGGDCSIQVAANWQLGSGDTSFVGGSESNKINLSIKSTDYPLSSVSSPLVYNYTNSTGSSVCTFTLPSGIGATITSVSVNGSVVSPSGYSFNPSTGVLTLTDCLANEGNISVSYNTISNTVAILSGETVAMIVGNCAPILPITITNSCNADIPDGVTIIIDIDGSIKWWGAITSADGTYGYIDVENIIYSNQTSN